MEIVLYKNNKDFKWVMSKDNFLSQSECEEYIEKIKNNEEVIKDEDFIKHNGRFISFNDDPISNKIFNVVKLANTMCFKFDIGGVGGCFGKHYSEVDFAKISDEDFENFHSDLSPEDNLLSFSKDGKNNYSDDEGLEKKLDVFDTTTKITTILFLNNDFEGGELQVWNTPIEPKPGRLVMFPSFAAHKIKKFSGDDRFVIATFIKGNYFK